METPADVTSLALSRGLGRQVAERSLPSPLKTGASWLAVAAVSLGLLFVVGLGQDSGGLLYAGLRFIALFFCFLMVYSLAMGIRVFLQGAQSFHVFTGGFVHRRNGRSRAYRWPEIAELRPLLSKRGADAGRLLNYQLVPSNGKPVGILLVMENDRDSFLDDLMGLLYRHGIPVS